MRCTRHDIWWGARESWTTPVPWYASWTWVKRALHFWKEIYVWGKVVRVCGLQGLVGLHMNESCLTHAWVMSQVCMSHDYVTDEWVTKKLCVCHRWVWVMSVCVISRALHVIVWMSHVSHMNESCLTYEWVMSHIWMSHVSHMNESCLTYWWVMSHMWMSHVSHRNESRTT